MRSMDDLRKLLLRCVRHSVVSLEKVAGYYRDLNSIKSGRRQPFVVHPRALGLPPALSYDDVEGLLEVLEGAAHLPC